MSLDELYIGKLIVYYDDSILPDLEGWEPTKNTLDRWLGEVEAIIPVTPVPGRDEAAYHIARCKVICNLPVPNINRPRFFRTIGRSIDLYPVDLQFMSEPDKMELGYILHGTEI